MKGEMLVDIFITAIVYIISSGIVQYNIYYRPINGGLSVYSIGLTVHTARAIIGFTRFTLTLTQRIQITRVGAPTVTYSCCNIQLWVIPGL